jgi:hypothetical protein
VSKFSPKLKAISLPGHNSFQATSRAYNEPFSFLLKVHQQHMVIRLSSIENKNSATSFSHLYFAFCIISSLKVPKRLGSPWIPGLPATTLGLLPGHLSLCLLEMFSAINHKIELYYILCHNLSLSRKEPQPLRLLPGCPSQYSFQISKEPCTIQFFFVL